MHCHYLDPMLFEWDPVFDFVDHGLDAMVREEWDNELLCMAANAGCMALVRRLMGRTQHDAELRGELLRELRSKELLSSLGRSIHQSIGEAVLGNYVDVVEYLLGEKSIEPHLQYRNSRGENIFHLASRLCNPAIFHLLVPRFQEGIHQVDDQGDTALVWIIMSSAASQDRHESARTLLLQGGTDWSNNLVEDQRDPLRVAVQLGDSKMCRLLVCTGKMDPLSALARDNDGRPVLKDITPENEHNALEMLQFLVHNT